MSGSRSSLDTKVAIWPPATSREKGNAGHSQPLNSGLEGEHLAWEVPPVPPAAAELTGGLRTAQGQEPRSPAPTLTCLVVSSRGRLWGVNNSHLALAAAPGPVPMRADADH